MMAYSKGLAERALNENLYRLREGKTDPLNLNLHVALLQMALMMEDLRARQAQQDERFAALERSLGSRRRRSYVGRVPAEAEGL